MCDKTYGLGAVKVPNRDAVSSTDIRSARLQHHEGATRFIKDDIVESELLIRPEVSN